MYVDNLRTAREMNTNRSGHRLRIGLFSIGLEAYWSQFAGLKERLESYNANIAKRIEMLGVQVTNLGLIDTPHGGRMQGTICARLTST